MNVPLQPVETNGGDAPAMAAVESGVPELARTKGSEPPPALPLARCCRLGAAALVPTLGVVLGGLYSLASSGGGGMLGGQPVIGTKVGLKTIDPLAVCNDGSEAVYYFAAASDPDRARVWQIWLQGGGNCWDEASCSGRNKPLTSTNIPDAEALCWGPCFPDSWSMPGGVLSSSDPSFGGSNKAYVKYCTSDLHIGDRGSEGSPNGWQFRGLRVVRAVVKDLEAKGLSHADTVVLSGCSAGAMGATVLCDSIQSWLPFEANVVCLFDSNLPVLDVPALQGSKGPPAFEKGASMATNAKDWIEIYNVSQSILHPSCADRPPAERWKCVWPEYVLPTISNPWFMLSARFDAYGAALETSEMDIGMNTYNLLWPFGDENLNAWGRAQGKVAESLPAPDQPYSAVFQPGCVTHCGQMQGTQYSTVSAGDGTTLRNAIHQWYASIGVATTSPEVKKWVDTNDVMALRGSCYGFSDLWISLFRSLILLWIIWAVHLTQRLCGKTDVTMVMFALAGAAARHTSNSAHQCTRQGKWHEPAAWVLLWFSLLMLCVLGRQV